MRATVSRATVPQPTWLIPDRLRQAAAIMGVDISPFGRVATWDPAHAGYGS
jgi:hypothetical protein